MKFSFNLVEHFPLFKHLLAGQLKSIYFFYFFISLFLGKKKRTYHIDF